MEEEISVLACHEVYLYNGNLPTFLGSSHRNLLSGDVKEFLDTLGIIEKLQYFKNDKVDCR